ncbi:hypothetical protein [Janthinobacterium agaricidamnosum]|uniref:Uncharacterized protein n=1 Tax=Janthinobacterium agaricidamnosum NBRC 102515 = DSM 9628 TaxID=1349767 RepID=W0VDC9_9BURK|nr:hypothetical protein [Janthinobacterium agaricidamnosum]CDG85916.1 hypothetical protein GJA_5320 [Janthinobacterium agaricidamnosum NBRC 102515 = DSM 9628]
MITPTGRLAEDEFAFRYLSPSEAITHARAPDRFEQNHQFVRGAGGQGRDVDLSALFRALVTGQEAPRGELRQRLLTVLLQVHLPGSVTPLTGYGLHASYPSPRGYYPMQFLLEERAREALWHVDMDALSMRHLGAAPAGIGDDAPYALCIKTDFDIYAPLYNLFRKSLFALECGHFLSEFLLLAGQLGIGVAPQVAAGAIKLLLREDGSTEPVSDPLAAHRHFARERNSGRFFRGFFPAPSTFCQQHLAQLTAAIGDAVREAVRLFPGAQRLKLTAKLCLRASPGVAAGIYRVDPDGLACLTPDDPIDHCERLYNYPSFNFRFVPAMVFWCIDELAYACADDAFLEMNLVLGFLNQQLIRVILDGEMLGRPFRSYDQLGIDRLLRNADDGVRTYYGLMVVRNRCGDALGVLR